METYLAVDIGASSGRHILGWVEEGRLCLEEIYRFENTLVRKNGRLCWDMERLAGEVLRGLERCRELGKIPSTMGIDTWAVDYVLLDERGQPLGDTVAYRDSRTQGMDKLVEQRVPFQELYRRTGIQKQDFNTIYQLMAVKTQEPGLLEKAQRLLMVPEYLTYRLTGKMENEYTNATTTGLVNARTKTWDGELLDTLGYPRRLFGEPRLPGYSVGGFTPEVRARVGFDCQVLFPATHDTGSAFLAVPAKENGVYLSSGTWSLLGTELPEPITTPESLARNFTNEGGYQYRFRYLKNIMGLWMLQSIRREAGEARHLQRPGAWPPGKPAAFPAQVDVAPQPLPGPGEHGRGRPRCLPGNRPARAPDLGRAGRLRVPQPGPQLRPKRTGSSPPSPAGSYTRREHRGRRQPGRLTLNQLTANATGLPGRTPVPPRAPPWAT